MSYVPESIEYRIKEMHETEVRLLDLCDLAPLQLIEEMFVEGGWYHMYGSNIEYRLPFVFAYASMIVSVMEHFPEWKLMSDSQFVWDSSGSAGRFFEYRLKGHDYYKRFNICMRSDVEGSTCILNKIGTKEVPVYEITCSEGALENAFNGQQKSN